MPATKQENVLEQRLGDLFCMKRGRSRGMKKLAH
jgi:hypothetical protein